MRLFLTISLILGLQSGLQNYPVVPMAHYTITLCNGRYRAQVRLKRNHVLVYSKSKTFKLRAAADAWAKRHVVEIEDEDPQNLIVKKIKFKELIKRYQKEYGALSAFGRTKRAQLDYLQRSPLGDEFVGGLTAARLIRHVQERRTGGAGPATVKNDLTWLRIVARTARVAWGVRINLESIDDAFTHCKASKLIGEPRRRSRRPSTKELQRLSDYLQSRDYRSKLPMYDIIWFAIHSTRREGEITRLMWTDNDETDMTGVVRDHKHPTAKEGNHRRFKYTREAWDLIQQRPRTDDRIFPFNEKSISSAFTKTCKVLEIPDLKFHDLRHEGTSRLFEVGYSIVEVQQFTLHEDWNVLRRYTNLRPGDVKHR